MKTKWKAPTTPIVRKALCRIPHSSSLLEIWSFGRLPSTIRSFWSFIHAASTFATTSTSLPTWGKHPRFQIIIKKGAPAHSTLRLSYLPHLLLQDSRESSVSLHEIFKTATAKSEKKQKKLKRRRRSPFFISIFKMAQMVPTSQREGIKKWMREETTRKQSSLEREGKINIKSKSEKKEIHPPHPTGKEKRNNDKSKVESHRGKIIQRIHYSMETKRKKK